MGDLQLSTCAVVCTVPVLPRVNRCLMYSVHILSLTKLRFEMDTALLSTSVVIFAPAVLLSILERKKPWGYIYIYRYIISLTANIYLLSTP